MRWILAFLVIAAALAFAEEPPLALRFLEAERAWLTELAQDPTLPPAYGTCGSILSSLPGNPVLAIDDPVALQRVLEWLRKRTQSWLEEQGVSPAPDRRHPLSDLAVLSGGLDLALGKFSYVVQVAPGEEPWGILFVTPVQEGASCLAVTLVDEPVLRALLGGEAPAPAPPR